MAYLRWIYKTWRYLWTFIGVLVLAIAVIAVTSFGILQLQPVKDRIATEIEERFNESRQGVLSIGKLDGLLPVQIELKDVKIYPDSSSFKPVFQTSGAEIGIDPWFMLRDQLRVNSLEITAPKAVFNGKEGASITQALQRRQNRDTTGTVFPELGILIPSVNISGGQMVFRNIQPEVRRYLEQQTNSLLVQDLNLDMFFEYSSEQRFLDIDRLDFQVPQLTASTFSLYGQIYNDNQFLEMNAMNMRLGESFARFSGEATNVNLIRGNLQQQFLNAQLEFVLDDFMLNPDEFVYIQEQLPRLNDNIRGTAEGNGRIDSLVVSSLEIFMGDSFFNLNGHLDNLTQPANLQYGAELEALMVMAEDLRKMGVQVNETQAQALRSGRLEGTFSGNIDSVSTKLNLISNRGNVNIDGTFGLQRERAFTVHFETDSVDIGGLLNQNIASSNLTLEGDIRSSSYDLLNSNGGLALQLREGNIDNYHIDQLSVLVNWRDGYFEPDLRMRLNGSSIESAGSINLRTEIPEYNLSGNAGQVEIQQVFPNQGFRNVVADLEYELNLKGNSFDDFYGQFSIDVPFAVTENDTLPRHQLYVDFNDPNSNERIIRFTSTALDATAEGSFRVGNLQQLVGHWRKFFDYRIASEFTLNAPEDAFNTGSLQIPNQEVSLNARIKNPDILRAYLLNFPAIQSSARLQSSINVSSDRLLLSGSFSDIETIYNQTKADSLNLQFTGSFRYDTPLKEFSGFQLQASGTSIETENINGRSFEFEGELDRDSLAFRNTILGLNEDITFRMEGEGGLYADSLIIKIPEFVLGSSTLLWRNQEVPVITYTRGEKVRLDQFVFQSGSQEIDIEGTYSEDLADSVNYTVRNVDLTNISDIIGGRIEFAGVMNGIFTTRTLTSVPTIQGNIDIEELTLNGNLAGDVNISSQLNQELNRFDTHVSIKTDSAKYPEYFENTDRKGQNFDIRGYVMAPQDGEFPEADSLYRFKADFHNIDLWILPLIGPKVFDESSGRADGSGLFWGNLDTYGFESDFMVGTESAAYLKPQFLETHYYAQGPISFSRSEGFVFDDIYLLDPSGGTGILSGYYNLNDFGPVDSLDISLEMNEFQFLNSSFDPTVAFFGEAYGSGTVTISGTNFDPVLRTETPMEITDFSEISIPLLEETEFNEDNRFIRFVDSFDGGANTQSASSWKFNGPNTSGNVEQQDLTFAERFTLDLQFVADNPMTVRLIFDPVTGDIVTAQGTGRMRILLEDEEVSMFGRFNIDGGRYQFVSGDIFTRRFELESGGSITWEGDPANARLDVNAIYSARPDINTLSSANRDPANAQRVPVDLVLNINGTISSIENDFFFRLPNTIETQQSSTLATQIATINRDEDLKLLQAANFMLMGDFIPVSSAGTTQSNYLTENISGSAAVLNPLISSQLINPLLSNQVNSLLNSDLSSLDVDFNLNTYNQVDLGVALRLYNDKLIFRREGQITGRQSNIGDLGATYQINRTFAVTAFHRQDLTFGTLASTEQSQQSQEINGVGVEAKVSFNTWTEFFNRLISPLKRLFGIRDQEEDEALTENNNRGDAPS
ncbi:translocation/assembly module TamB domain-containing protein [Gracilimonas mengyeensis]|uniref:Autotransporter translocation and assembly factor TamB n=1 Tax=Gracilimonas mengyeensis TaxID=1302730 RepID=A0A521C583_9BACT|nr:hypothetical protein [Gracilimonas mengyeensis]SMO54505.1 hypothetical protein SAMN06265219_104163 [Gracilimonas mengyeensis]